MEITTISVSREDAKAFRQMKLEHQSLSGKQMSDWEFFHLIIENSSKRRENL